MFGKILLKYFCEVGWWSFAGINTEYSFLEFDFSSIAILELLIKQYSSTSNKLLSSDICFKRFFHIPRIALNSCYHLKWSLFRRVNSLFRLFQLLFVPLKWNSWVKKLMFLLRNAASRQTFYQVCKAFLYHKNWLNTQESVTVNGTKYIFQFINICYNMMVFFWNIFFKMKIRVKFKVGAKTFFKQTFLFYLGFHDS